MKLLYISSFIVFLLILVVFFYLKGIARVSIACPIEANIPVYFRKVERLNLSEAKSVVENEFIGVPELRTSVVNIPSTFILNTEFKKGKVACWIPEGWYLLVAYGENSYAWTKLIHLDGWFQKHEILLDRLDLKQFGAVPEVEQYLQQKASSP